MNDLTKLAAILLVPTEAHRKALIGDGPCGSRAPVVVPPQPIPGPLGGPPAGHWATWHLGRCWDPGAALVLAWCGKPVADGLARLERVAEQAPYPRPDFATVRLYAQFAQGAGFGRLVLLDADGREVAS